MLKKMRRENRAHFNTMARDMSAIHGRLDLLVTSHHDIAAAQASHGEISAIHSEVDRLRQLVSDLDARVELLEPEDDQAP
jgi:hypothetical protein